MLRMLENKAVCATLFVLFTLAIVVNTLAGGSLPAFGTSPFAAPDIQERADGPVEEVADGPVFPPDPWERDKEADGPVFPPDPWERDKAA